MKDKSIFISLGILTLVNLFSVWISEIIVSFNTIYSSKDQAYYTMISSYSQSINFIYLVLSLILITVYYKRKRY